MKRFKVWTFFICCVFVLVSLPRACFAYERKDHDDYMLEVLFKNFKEVKNDKSIAAEINALGCASYLAIDQFNNNGQSDLDFLREYGVKGIPSNISDISFSASGTTHRSHTHRGWDYTLYVVTKEQWPKRKQILLNTADAIFDFQGNEAKKDSFCALLYYIHIIGDHMDDSSYLIKNGLKMSLGGEKHDETIIDELLKHFKILFADQRHTFKYFSLTTRLKTYDYELAAIVGSRGGIDNPEKFEQKQRITKKVMKVLTMYIPEMLKDEPFFSEVFYERSALAA